MTKVSLKKVISNQKNLERVLDNLKDGIIAHDLNRRIFYINRAAEKITGYSKKELLGKDCHKAFGEPFCGGRCSFLNDNPAIADKAEYSINIRAKDGQLRQVENDDFSLQGGRSNVRGELRCPPYSCFAEPPLSKVPAINSTFCKSSACTIMYGNVQILQVNNSPAGLSP